MGSNERRERERHETRGKILDAARELFAAHGFEAVTMRKIAEKIEYTPTAIYFHFKDKDALIQELCVTDFLSFAQKFAAIAAVADPVERLGKMGRVYGEFGLAHPNSYRIMFMHGAKPATALEATAHKGDPAQDAYAFLKWTIAEAIDKGLFRKELSDVELAAQVIWAAMHGIVSLEISKGHDAWVDWRPFERRIGTMVDVMLHGFLEPKTKPKTKR